jgi:hypothetical protein
MNNDLLPSFLDECLTAIENSDLTPEESLSRFPEHRIELAELLGVVSAIKNTPHEPVDQDFRNRTRAMLLNKAIHSQPVTFWERFRLRLQETILLQKRRLVMPAVLVITILFSLLGVGSVYASEASIPGDLLYPVKLLVEDVRLAFTGEEQDADLYFQFAEKRLKEVDTLVERGRFEGMGEALDRFETQIDQAARVIPAENNTGEFPVRRKPVELTENVGKQIEVLTELLETVPDEARPALEYAIEISSKGRSKLNELFPEGQSSSPTVDTPPATELPPVTAPPVQELPEPPVNSPPGPPGNASPGSPQNSPQGPPDWADPPRADPSPAPPGQPPPGPPVNPPAGRP